MSLRNFPAASQALDNFLKAWSRPIRKALIWLFWQPQHQSRFDYVTGFPEPITPHTLAHKNVYNKTKCSQKQKEETREIIELENLNRHE